MSMPRLGKAGLGSSVASRSTTAAAPAFEIARGEVDALRDRAVDLLGIEAADLCGGDGGAEDAEHRPGVKAARHDGRDELGGHPLHDLITGGDAGQKDTAGTAA